jgi:hypothetical protein
MRIRQNQKPRGNARAYSLKTIDIGAVIAEAHLIFNFHLKEEVTNEGNVKKSM